MVKPVNNNFWIKAQYNGTNLNYQFRFPPNFNYYIGTITKSIVNKQFVFIFFSLCDRRVVCQQHIHFVRVLLWSLPFAGCRVRVRICAYDVENHQVYQTNFFRWLLCCFRTVILILYRINYDKYLLARLGNVLVCVCCNRALCDH